MKIILLCLLTASICEARLLLVPSANTRYESYHDACRQEGYACSFDYLTGLLAAKPTPDFDRLLDQLDLNDRRSMDQFRNRLIHVLNSEEISMLQLEMLMTVMREMNRIQPTVYFQIIEGELRHLHASVNAPVEAKPQEFIYIFKKRFPLAKFSSLKTSLLKIPLYVLHYSSLPLKTDTREMRLQKKIPLVQGKCEQEKLTRPFSRTEWKILRACENEVTEAADSESTLEEHHSVGRIQ